MPQRIIDHFKTVHINRKYHHMPFASLRTGNRRVDPIKQQRPVRQTGQRIMLNQITNPFFSRFSFTVVGKM